MSIRVAARIARRELRGGLKGFRVFLACLAFGVAAIAAIGSVRTSIQDGLTREGATLLGGDAEIQLTYRYANADERAWMDRIATGISEIVEFRSMAVVGTGPQAERGLTQVKAVDLAYPLLGQTVLDPPMALAEALDGNDGLPGAVMARLLVDRLGLQVGDRFALGAQQFVLSAVLVRQADAGGGFSFGPATIVRSADLATSGLLQPGTLFDTAYRMTLPAEADLSALKRQAAGVVDGAGRWRDKRNGAPGVSRFVEHLGDFLVLVGLAGLIIGGVGVSAAVRAFLDEKVTVIATLKSIGAEGRTIFQAYFIQIGILALLGIGLGLVLGALAPLGLAPLIEASLPVGLSVSLYPLPLAQAALYGVLTAAIFALWPLARAERIRAAVLFRDAAFGLTGRPAARYVIVIGALIFLLLSMAMAFTGDRWITLWAAVGLFGAYVILVIAGDLVRRGARYLARLRFLRHRTSLRQALAAVGGPGSDAATVVVSLGLGLAVLSAIGQIDNNLRKAITQELPDVAPSFFFVDIQPEQMPGFMQRLEGDEQVSRVDTAPMLRGVITRINGLPAREVVGDHWVISGDRGITYSAEAPVNAEITEGAWWSADYAGPPLISFSAEEGAEMGLSLGDTMTVNVLGRDITGEISSFRNVDFSNAGMGFVLSMNPSALAGAPHSFIATVYAEQAAEASILRDLASAYPNITAIGVRDAINQVGDILRAVAGAITFGALASLATGALVLVGAAAAGERARTYEGAILKTLGATRSAILANFSLRAALLGAVAGGVATMAGALGSWAVLTFVMEADFDFEPVSALVIIGAGIMLTVLSGAAFTLRALAARPAQTLRARE